MATPLEVLNHYWKHKSFKGSQNEIIDLVLSNKNVVAVLPTGGGKSICYQIPGLIKNGICIVISPLIALMNDQVMNLKELGIKAMAITSALSHSDIINEFDNLKYGDYKFLYLSPEKLQSSFIQEKIKELNVSLIAIDEVHCISEWGHDFRPAYLKIPNIYELHPMAPVIGLTATATTNVLNDIINHLNKPNIKIIRQSLIRNNLAFRVIRSEDYRYYLRQILKNTLLPSIVYTNSRKKANDVSDYLNRNNLTSTFYHGGLSAKEKQISFMNWMNEKTMIMVATNAFGMGINKHNVQTIVHIDLPNSLENYMQEAGRAGRNYSKAYSYIIASENGITNLKRQFLKSNVSYKDAKKIYNLLNQYFQIAYGELPKNYFEFHIDEFCAHNDLDIVQTQNTLKAFEKEQILFFDKNLNKQSTIKFTVSPNEVLRYSETNRSTLIKALLRSYGGLFERHININEALIAKKTERTYLSIQNELIKLSGDGLLEYHRRKKASRIQFLLPREDDLTIRKIKPYLKHRWHIKRQKINDVIEYVNNNKNCRRNYLLAYFNEENNDNCGICDICNKSDTVSYKRLTSQILTLLASDQPLSSKEIISHFNTDKSVILTALQLLLDNNKITITSQNKLEMVSNG